MFGTMRYVQGEAAMLCVVVVHYMRHSATPLPQARTKSRRSLVVNEARPIPRLSFKSTEPSHVQIERLIEIYSNSKLYTRSTGL